MNRDSVNWRGYMPALTTPFTQGGALDVDGWRTLVEWAVEEGMHGIVVAGSSGEWFSLEPEERVELFRVAKEQVNGRIPVLGGCNALRVTETHRYIEAADEIGLDGILLGIPPYSVPNDAEIVAFYEMAASVSPLPLCLYNWPRGNVVDMSIALVERLSAIDTVVAIKNSTKTFDGFVEMFQAVRDELRVFGFGTDERSIALIRGDDGVGTIGGGAVLGRIHPGFYDHLWAGDLDSARLCGEKDRRFFNFSMTPAYDPAFASAPAVTKAALDARGLPGGPPRPPLLALTADETARVQEFMATLDLPEVSLSDVAARG